MQWIKCSDELPPVDTENCLISEKVLTINRSGKIQVAVYMPDWLSPWTNEVWQAHWNDDGCCELNLDSELKIPTHWMPLPEKPKDL